MAQIYQPHIYHSSNIPWKKWQIKPKFIILLFFLLLYGMPAQKAGTQKHGQPELTDIWEKCKTEPWYRWAW